MDGSKWEQTYLQDFSTLPGNCQIISDKELASDMESIVEKELNFTVEVYRV